MLLSLMNFDCMNGISAFTMLLLALMPSFSPACLIWITEGHDGLPLKMSKCDAWSLSIGLISEH